MWILAEKERWPSGTFSFPETCNMAAAMETEQPGLEVFETAGCEEQVQREEQPKPEPFYVERHSWSQLRKLLTDTRKYHGYMMAKAPHDFTFVKKNDPEGPHSDRIYYLGKFAGAARVLTRQSLQRLFGFNCSSEHTWFPLGWSPNALARVIRSLSSSERAEQEGGIQTFS